MHTHTHTHTHKQTNKHTHRSCDPWLYHPEHYKHCQAVKNIPYCIIIWTQLLSTLYVLYVTIIIESSPISFAQLIFLATYSYQLLMIIYTVNQIVRMFLRVRNLFSYGAVILIMKPTEVDNTKVSNYFFQWNPDMSRLVKRHPKWWNYHIM